MVGRLAFDLQVDGAVCARAFTRWLADSRIWTSQLLASEEKTSSQKHTKKRGDYSFRIIAGRYMCALGPTMVGPSVEQRNGLGYNPIFFLPLAALVVCSIPSTSLLLFSGLISLSLESTTVQSHQKEFERSPFSGVTIF